MIVALPISRVVVMEDRAQVERVGSCALDGRTRLELGPVAVVAVDRSLEVEVDGATLLDARLLRRRRERPAGGLFVDASALRREVQAAERELDARADAWTRARVLVDALGQARADVLRGIAEGVGAGQADTDAWAGQLDEIEARQRAAAEAARVAEAEHARTQRHLAEARGALTGAEPPEPELECLLVLTLEGQGTAQVRARYQVPCAAWRPAYRARLADAVVWQRTGEDWTDVALLLSTARPTLGTTPPTLVEDRLTTRAKQAIEKQSTEVALREVAIASNTEGTGADELPGVDDGGETRLLEVPAKVAIPSDGMPHRLQLFDFAAPATSTCVCAPELAPEACVVATFTNLADRPLLAGPVDLARVAGSGGRSSVSFTAPGAPLELSFGSEDGVRVLRDVEVERDTSRLTGKLTQRSVVTLYVSNASGVARTVELHERVLVSEVKEVEVLERECSPRPRAVDRDGIARIQLELAPNATTTATFVWEFRAAGKVAGL
jgi:uncharacterized protein (TIGR02231 family)